MGLFGDWQRMYKANQQHLDQQGKPSSFFGQIADIPNQMKEAADNTDLGLRMSRHLQLTNGEGLPAVAIVDGSWQVGTYANTSPVVRITARVERADGTEPYIVTCDHVVAAMQHGPDATRLEARRDGRPAQPDRLRHRLDPHRAARTPSPGLGAGAGCARRPPRDLRAHATLVPAPLAVISRGPAGAVR